MKRQIKIKAGNISNLTDARYFAAYMVEWMGFNFSKTDTNALQLEDATTIKNWIVGPKLITEFDTIDLDYIFQVTTTLGTNQIQLNSDEDVSKLNEYQIFKKPIMVTSVEEANAVLKKNENALLNINGNIDLAKQIIEKTTVTAIEIQGSAEIQTGLKSYDEINDLFEFLEDKDYT